MSHQVFISFSSKDKKFAEKIYDRLVKHGISCWMSSRNIPPGGDYQGCIVDAINQAEIVVLVFSAQANRSNEVAKELSLASKKAIIPARIEDVLPQGAFQFQLTNRQFIDLFDDFENKLEELSERIGTALGKQGVQEPQDEEKRRPQWRTWLGAFAVLIILIAGGWFLFERTSSRHNDDSVTVDHPPVPKAESPKSSGGAPTAPAATEKAVNIPSSEERDKPRDLKTALPSLPGNMSSGAAVQQLRGTTGAGRVDSIKNIAPKLSSSLSGEDVAMILDGLNGADRATGLDAILRAKRVKDGLTANEAVTILKDTAGVPRIESIKRLAPVLSANLGGEDIASILDSLYGADRATGLDALLRAKRVKDGLTANEAVDILKDTAGAPRIESIKRLAPVLSANLGGDDVVAIVGNLSGRDYQLGLDALLRAKRVKSALTAKEVVGILKDSAGVPRAESIKDLASLISSTLDVNDIVAILGSLSGRDRQRGLEPLARSGKVSKGLTPDDMERIADGTADPVRLEIMKMLR